MITYYTNWTYKDTAGVNHVFNGTSYAISGSPANCPAQSTGGFTSTIADGNGTITLSTNGSNGVITISANVFPSYHILTLLYDPPGNQSDVGVTNTTFYGVTNSIGSTFTAGNTLTYTTSGSIFGIGGGTSSSVSFSKAFGVTNAFTDTISSGASLTLPSHRNPIDHTNDLFWIWLNPQVTITQTGSNAATYTLAPPSGQPMVAVRASVAQLKTPTVAGFLPILEPQVINGVTYPGLSNICAHPLPAAQCTQANACGCVASDFTQILNQDPIRAITSNTPPSQTDPNRYVLLNPPPSPFPLLEPGSTVGFTLSDANQAAQTQTETTTYQTSYTTQAGVNVHSTPVDFTLQFSQTNTFSWSTSVALTKFTGSSHLMSLDLGTTTTGCTENVNIYEDYAYHTFVSVPASTPPAPCNSN
jgi:hypothetical protein